MVQEAGAYSGARQRDRESLQRRNVPSDAGGQATAGAVGSLTDGGQDWPVNAWAGKYVSIVAGTGTGQTRRIASNTSTVLTPATNFTTAPDATSVYIIFTVGEGQPEELAGRIGRHAVDVDVHDVLLEQLEGPGDGPVAGFAKIRVPADADVGMGTDVHF